MIRPNIPEKIIGKILEGIDIKFKFLQDIDYKTIENKQSSKEIDIVWKDSVGNKKIIEYNGYRHYDNRCSNPMTWLIITTNLQNVKIFGMQKIQF